MQPAQLPPNPSDVNELLVTNGNIIVHSTKAVSNISRNESLNSGYGDIMSSNNVQNDSGMSKIITNCNVQKLSSDQQFHNISNGNELQQRVTGMLHHNMSNEEDKTNNVKNDMYMDVLLDNKDNQNVVDAINNNSNLLSLSEVGSLDTLNSYASVDGTEASLV